MITYKSNAFYSILHASQDFLSDYFKNLLIQYKVKKNLTRAPLDSGILESTGTQFSKYYIDQLMEHTQQIFGIQKNMNHIFGKSSDLKTR